jgi:adenylate cyclase
LGNVGAVDHYEYRAVGDTVNTATRIEGLNKFLDTQILVSEKVIKGLTSFTTREIGFFILKGKKKPVHIFELIGKANQNCSRKAKFNAAFANALKSFQQYQWEDALKQWNDIHTDYPHDGATLFYINYLTRNKAPLSVQNQFNQPAIVNIGNITIPLEIQSEPSIQ